MSVKIVGWLLGEVIFKSRFRTVLPLRSFRGFRLYLLLDFGRGGLSHIICLVRVDALVLFSSLEAATEPLVGGMTGCCGSTSKTSIEES